MVAARSYKKKLLGCSAVLWCENRMYGSGKILWSSKTVAMVLLHYYTMEYFCNKYLWWYSCSISFYSLSLINTDFRQVEREVLLPSTMMEVCMFMSIKIKLP
jgi:hypothetical protein